MTCARGDIPSQGHRNESLPLDDMANYDDDIITPDIIRGNFMALLDLQRQAGDQRIDIFINKKSKYTCSTIQNELLMRISDDIITQVVEEINKAKYYTIITDETRDNSNTEQLCLAIRYHSLKSLRTEEKFIRFVPLQSLRGGFLNYEFLKCR